MTELSNKLTKFWDGQVHYNCSLAKYSTIGIGGPAEALVKPGTIDGLAQLIKILHSEKISYFVMGRGSNLIISDQGVAGVVVVLAENLAKIEMVEDCTEYEQGDPVKVKVEAGCTLTRLINWCIEHELSGLEFLTGIPGSIGGAIVMNAGALGREVGEVVDSVSMLNSSGEIYSRKTNNEEFKYRKWTGLKDETIIAGCFSLFKDKKLNIKHICQSNLKQRKSKQPQKPSAGSIFKNPPGDYAGRLIERAGLKGEAVGGAQISSVHANFIVNTGGATSEDVLTLVEIIREKVKREAGIWLELEVEIISD